MSLKSHTRMYEFNDYFVLEIEIKYGRSVCGELQKNMIPVIFLTRLHIFFCNLKYMGQSLDKVVLEGEMGQSRIGGCNGTK